nr:MAG TPA: hypothetical protein [Caudoviricetes sp.]
MRFPRPLTQNTHFSIPSGKIPRAPRKDIRKKTVSYT